MALGENVVALGARRHVIWNGGSNPTTAEMSQDFGALVLGNILFN